MDTCEVLEENLGPDLSEMARRSRESGREHAMSICPTGDYRGFSGDSEGVEIEECGDEWANVHTHPPGNPVRPSRQDIGSFLLTEEDEFVSRMCILGSGIEELHCVEIDRSDMTRDEYIDFVNEIDGRVRDEGPIDLSDYDSVSSCTRDLSSESLGSV